MNSIYEDSQDIIEGQKQGNLESATLFAMKPINGLTKTQTSHIKKLNIYKDKYHLSLDSLSNMLGITPGQCLDILQGREPLTEQMQQAFYQNGGNKFSTNRLNKDADKLKDARQFKNTEIYNKYIYAQKPITCKKLLCTVPLKGLNKKQQQEYYSLTKYSYPKLGLYLKAFRAKTGDTQYSIPEKLRQFYPIDFPICSRPFWRQVETTNYIPAIGNRAFYRLFHLSVEQAIAPFVEAEKHENIESAYSYDEVRELQCV